MKLEETTSNFVRYTNPILIIYFSHRQTTLTTPQLGSKPIESKSLYRSSELDLATTIQPQEGRYMLVSGVHCLVATGHKYCYSSMLKVVKVSQRQAIKLLILHHIFVLVFVDRCCPIFYIKFWPLIKHMVGIVCMGAHSSQL